MSYRIFEGCRIVEGYDRCAICDLQRGTYKFYPKLIADIVDSKGIICNRQTISEEDFQCLTNVLLNDEVIFPIDDSEINHFPNLDLTWKWPAYITNCIVVWKDSLFTQYTKLIKDDFLRMNCRHLQIQIYHTASFALLKSIQDIINDSIIQSVEYISNNNVFTDVDELKKWVTVNRKIRFVSISEEGNNHIISNGENGMGIIVNTAEKITSPMQCGNIHYNYFSVNIDLFTEAQHHNTCLNRKICIDANGDIKNCPAMEKSYGNIRGTTLQEAIEKPGFKDCWTICKDQIDVCKDCEFRYMCTDCRAFIKDPENLYSQPAKCTYNPYICLWEGQDGYVPVEECGIYSRETGFVPDKDKIAELNRIIWEEKQ
ncbi:MAG: grasp-with-spasm system SPASM domain peptide maturase [Bacteroidales bacterium]|nr:grasp-with-spasm system SPASM domain peptide maturase [Bacteroidales bacterium]